MNASIQYVLDADLRPLLHFHGGDVLRQCTEGGVMDQREFAARLVMRPFDKLPVFIDRDRHFRGQ